MGTSSSRIGSGHSPQAPRLNGTRRKLTCYIPGGCNGTSSSTSHSSVLELESPTNSTENVPPASVESISSAGVSSSFLCSEPVCTCSKTSESDAKDSESCNTSAKNASTSYESQSVEELALGNNGPTPASTFERQNVVDEGLPVDSSDNIVLGNHDSDTGALLVISDSFVSVRTFRSGLTASGNGILVESVSASSDMLSGGVFEINSREERRNNGFLFGGTSSRQRHRRESSFSSLFLTTGFIDDFGSRERLPFDNSGEFHHGHGYSRSRGRNEDRRRFRSQMSERGLGGLNEDEYQARICVSGLHRDGTCSCGSSFMGEETGSLGSISRVILLAHALSEVLDEIYRQPLPLSMPMLSLPAPVLVVDSLLLKRYKKTNASESGPSYVQQCYICLVDYEEGDKIRVLPCHHEYHAPCVDKWLKEVNGVCPVCRCNVCDTPLVSTSEHPA